MTLFVCFRFTVKLCLDFFNFYSLAAVKVIFRKSRELKKCYFDWAEMNSNTLKTFRPGLLS